MKYPQRLHAKPPHHFYLKNKSGGGWRYSPNLIVMWVFLLKIGRKPVEFVFQPIENMYTGLHVNQIDSDVGSSYPGAGEGPKGLAVRQLKRYASWVQTDVSQVGLLSTTGVDSWEGLSLVREDRDERTSGLSAVPPGALSSSYVRLG